MEYAFDRVSGMNHTVRIEIVTRVVMNIMSAMFVSQVGVEVLNL
jgi:hypothetical protein